MNRPTYSFTRISYLDWITVTLCSMDHGVTIREQNRLQCICTCLLRTTKFQSISTFLCDSLHWLPISQRVRFKVILMVWNSFLGRSPRYLQGFVCLCPPINFAVVCDHLSKACYWFQRATPHSCKDEVLPSRDHVNGIVFRSWLEMALPRCSEASSKHSCFRSSWSNSRTVLDGVPENL